MSLVRNIASGLRTLFRKEQVSRELDEELNGFLDMAVEEKMKQGMSRKDALRAVRLERGNVEVAKETIQAARWESFVETLLWDIRHALRRLRMSPAFTSATVLTLALGIGATTSIFTLVHTVLLKSLPVANPGELYRLGKESRCCYQGGYSQEKEFSLVSYDLYKYLRDNTKGFSELAAFPSSELLLGLRRTGTSEAAQGYPGEFVSGNYFSMFGIKAYAGRALTDADDQPNAPPVVVMSYRLWQQKYGSGPSVIGGVFDIDGKPFTVVGITPPGFYGDSLRTSPPDLFLPLNTEPYVQSDADLNKVDTHWLELIGRIQPGANPASIGAEMRVELKQWLRSHWSDMSANDRARFPEQTLYLTPGGAGITAMREQYEHWLLILMMVSGFVLLIVCANVANLMLVRGMERRRQTSLSMALGAQTPRILRQPLTESFLLASFGGAASLVIAFACTLLILHFAFPVFGGFASVPISASPSKPVLLFAFVVSLLTGVAFGVGPAWMATRADPIEALRGSGRSTARVGSLPRKTLVVVQAALSLVLVSAAGLLTAALQRLEHQDLGFVQDRRIVASMDPRLAGYRSDQLPTLYRRIHDRIATLPGVSSVALSQYSPVGYGWGAGVWVDGHPVPGPNDDNSAAWDRVSAGYLDVIGTPIVRGRGISDEDTASSRKVAVINEAFARKFFRNEDPIGKHFGTEADNSRRYEVVGIGKNARYLALDRPDGAFFFLPEAQADYSQTNLGSLFLHDIVILTRPGGSLSDAQVRQAMASVDPSLPIISIRTLKEKVATQLTQQQLIAHLTSLFGILSLVLASIGLYGITSYNVERQRGEIGVRMALGASRSQVVRLVLRGAFLLVAFGLILGIPLSLATSQVLSSQLYGLSPYDAVPIAIAVAVLGFFGLVATLVPAQRASSIPPAEALRSE
ncbi:MAG TPA: ABC transporter permease [Candidatus Dormibacteraeota bacterium]|nr:ABC transporter permease [Candidatus Dormibacteraeota bacterium]